MPAVLLVVSVATTAVHYPHNYIAVTHYPQSSFIPIGYVMLAFIGTQSNLIWLAAPFGVAWVAVGCTFLLSGNA